MPPKAKAKAGAQAKAKAGAKAAAAPPLNALQRAIRDAVAAGNQLALSRNQETLYINKAGGGRLILERAGRLLSAGEAYYRHRSEKQQVRIVGAIDFNQPQQFDWSGRNTFIKDRQ